MTSSAAPRETPAIRHARAADLRHVAGIEDSGAGQFEALFGDDMAPALSSPAPSGAARVARPGFLLVAGDPPVGFAHVLEIDHHAQLDQLSVHPDAQGQGIGAALVRAAMREARAHGHRRLSLCTYRDVPWNAPFYRALGFTEVTDLLPFQRRMREREVSLGLDANGPRIVMSVALTAEVTGE